MTNIEKQSKILNLYRQHVYLMEEYADLRYRDDIVEIKRALLQQMEKIEKEIKKLESRDGVFQIR